MPPKKKVRVSKATLEALTNAEGSAMTPSALWGASEAPANATKGLMSLPTELITKILAPFRAVGALTELGRGGDGFHRPDGAPVLDMRFLVRPEVLRALSQTCVAYRKRFAPLLWERLDSCVSQRERSGAEKNFYRHVGTTLLRKSIGLTKNKDIAQMVGIVNVCLTRFQTETILPAFVECLKSLPNLHTIHVLHAHTQMTTPIRLAFEGVSLPSVRTVIIPGNCHEFLKSCPEVRSVTSLTEGGSKLIGVMGKNCKKIEEVRGFWIHDEVNMAKRLVKAAPNLRILEIDAFKIEDEVLALLKTLKNLCVVEILINDAKPTLDLKAEKLQSMIKTSRALLAATEKKYLRVLHNGSGPRDGDHIATIDVGMQ